MAYEHKEGQGSLFKNDKQNDRQPDFKGTIMIGGTTYEIAAWNRTSQNGREYLSLQASLPRQNDAAPHQGGYCEKVTGYRGNVLQNDIDLFVSCLFHDFLLFYFIPNRG